MITIIDTIYKLIQDEIESDPIGIGYAGKTDAEIVELLNEPQKDLIEIKKVVENKEII